jgi:hypothetical protein
MTDADTPTTESILIKLLELDYEASHRALDGFVSSASQLRAIGMAVWGVMYAAALAAHSVWVAAFAVLLLPAFAVADGYYSTLYRQTLERLRDIEKLLDGYHNAVGMYQRDDRRLARALDAIERHSIGVHRNLKAVNKERYWWVPRPLRLAAVYPLLFLIRIATTAALGTSSAHGTCRNGVEDQQPCVVVSTPAAAPDVVVERMPTKRGKLAGK